MIEVSPFVKIDENELQLDYIRASGPGGQNVNGVCTKTLTFLQTIQSLCLFHLLRA
jgi:protein subunit release factor B